MVALTPETTRHCAPLLGWLLCLGACDVVEDLAPPTGVPQACIDLNERLAGTWHESEGRGSADFPVMLVFQRTGPANGLLSARGQSLLYSISTECDAVLVTDQQGTLLITYSVTEPNEWLLLTNWNREHYYWKAGDEPTCPAAITVKEVVPIGIEEWAIHYGQTLATGVGAFTAMEVHPSTRPTGGGWDGLVVEEALSLSSDPCDVSQVKNPCLCDSSPCMQTFTVGAGFSGAQAGFADALSNVFWDFHTYTSPTSSLMHDLGQSGSCSASCAQTYAYQGRILSTHQVTREFVPDDLNGWFVTRVHVTKQ